MPGSKKKAKKFCGLCIWYRETQPFVGTCLKYNIATRMESYRFNCRDWAPWPTPNTPPGKA